MAERIRSILTGIDGVLNVQIDTTKEMATVTIDPDKTNAARLIKALNTEGIESSTVPDSMK